MRPMMGGHAWSAIVWVSHAEVPWSKFFSIIYSLWNIMNGVEWRCHSIVDNLETKILEFDTWIQNQISSEGEI